MAWMSGYSKRKPLIITGGASGAQTDFQLKLAVSHAAAMQADFDDLRFTQADGTTLIDAWLESKVDSTSALPWAEFPTTPANTVEQTYYMYYGNAGAASDWDIAATFEFGDDFSGDLSKWTIESGAWSISSGQLYCNAASAEALIRTSSYTGFGNDILECNWKYATFTTGGRQGMLTRYQDTSNYYATWLMQATVLTGGVKAIGIENKVAGSWGTFTYAAQDFSTGTYYDLKNRADGTTQKAFFEGTEKVSTTRSDFASGGIGFRTWHDDVYIDNVRVRKYVSGPPTYAFGSEESAPTGHPTMRRWGGIPGMQYTGRRSW